MMKTCGGDSDEAAEGPRWCVKTDCKQCQGRSVFLETRRLVRASEDLEYLKSWYPAVNPQSSGYPSVYAVAEGEQAPGQGHRLEVRVPGCAARLGPLPEPEALAGLRERVDHGSGRKMLQKTW